MSLDDVKKFFEIMKNGSLLDENINELRRKCGDSFLKPQDEINKIKRQFYKNLKIKPNINCLHPKSNECSGKPIKSHSLPTSILSKICDSTNHVFVFEHAIKFLEKPEIQVEKIGINKASIFLGLCAKHDSDTFKIIENDQLDINNTEHNFLFAYRAVLKECYVKTHVFEMFRQLLKQQIKNNQENNFIIELLKSIVFNHWLSLFLITEVKRRFDFTLLTRQYNLFLDFGCRVENESYPILVCSTFTPVYDFSSKLIEDKHEYVDTPLYVFLNIFPYESKTYFLYATLKNQTKKVASFLEGFYEKERIVFYHNMSDLILKYTENFVISPNYWNRFSAKQQESIIKYFSDTISKKNVKYDPLLHNIFISTLLSKQ